MSIKQGGRYVSVAEGVLGIGLKIGTTEKASGTAAGLSTSNQKLSFNPDSQLWIARRPRLIRFRAVGQTLTYRLGDQAAATILAADTWSSWLPCTALFNGVDHWWVTGGAESAMEYEIAWS